MGQGQLIEIQTALAGDSPRFLTLPEDFEISESDRNLLDALSYTIIRLPVTLRVAEAIGAATSRILDLVPEPARPLRLLFGDTHIDLGAEIAPDTVVVSEKPAHFAWTYHADGAFSETPPPRTAAADRSGHGTPAARVGSPNVVAGYFCFSDPQHLADAATGARTFADLLTAYTAAKPLRTVSTSDWFDFGHLQLFYSAKKRAIVSRKFNNIQIEGDTILKFSEQTEKMRAEANWFSNLPARVRLNTPRYLGQVDQNFHAGYRLEYMHMPTLDDIFTFSRLPFDGKIKILMAAVRLLKDFQTVTPDRDAPEASPRFAKNFHHSIYVEKNAHRIEDFLTSRGLAPETGFVINGTEFPPLQRVADQLAARISETQPTDTCFWHGDFFFGNLLYDFAADRVYCIDPRGKLNDGAPCLYGDRRYDIAKLCHSIVGGYDRIIRGRAKFQRTAPTAFQFDTAASAETKDVEAHFLEMVAEEFSMDVDEILAITAGLFLSMLPLHNDSRDRQDQLLASGLLIADRCLELAP